MEIAIPLIALGGMYVISNQQSDQSKKQVKFSKDNEVKEKFTLENYYNKMERIYQTFN